METLNIKSLTKQKEYVTGGTFACAGCQAVYGLRLLQMAFKKNFIIVNASGCMTLTATYPFTPYKVPWVFNAIENAASTASGIRMGLDSKKKRANKSVNVVAYAGDGASYDIGLQSLLGAADRNDNIIYICYNNNSYANTGYQRTSSTQLYSRTSTTPIGNKNNFGNLLPRKNLAKIVALRGAVYSATASTSHPFDFIKKLKKIEKLDGFKFIDLLCSCEPGWLISSDEMVNVSKRMVDSGIWPLYEILKDNKNEFHFILNSEKHIPVKDVLKLQGRFSHLTNKTIKNVQKIVNKEWSLMKKGKFFEAVEY